MSAFPKFKGHDSSGLDSCAVGCTSKIACHRKVYKFEWRRRRACRIKPAASRAAMSLFTCLTDLPRAAAIVSNAYQKDPFRPAQRTARS
jgi:hypothetical protein